MATVNRKQLGFILIAGLGLILKCSNAADDQNGQSSDGNGKPLVSYEAKLHNDLMANYHKWSRPVANFSTSVKVIYDMAYIRIVELHEKEQVLDFNAVFYQVWVDDHLKWNPEDYGGVTHLRIDVEELWTPEVVLYNEAYGGLTSMMTSNKLAVVINNGTIWWSPMVHSSVFCNLDLRRYPFDTQHCTVALGSWTYPKKEVHLTLNPGAGPEFDFPNTMWDVVVSKKAGEFVYGEHTLTMVMFTVNMERKTNFQQAMMVTPAVLLAFLLTAVFWIPPQAGERIHVGVGIIIATTLLLIMIDAYLPVELTSMPIIGMYLIFIYMMATISIVLSIFVLRCYHRDMSNSKVPRWMKTIFLEMIGKLVCVKPVAYTAVPSDVTVVDPGREMLSPHDLNLNEDQPLPRSPTMALEKVLDEIRQYLKICAAKETIMPSSSMPTYKQNLMTEWHQVALVLDRVFFTVTIIITIVVSIAMMAH